MKITARKLLIAANVSALLVLGCSLVLAPSVSRAIDVNHPIFKFCLLNVDASDFANCLDGTPTNAEAMLLRANAEIHYDVTAKVTVRGAPDSSRNSVTCPDEFRDVCQLLVDQVLAFGGNCCHIDGNTVCTETPAPCPD